MPKLVVLTGGLSGRSCELKGEKVSIGRMDDNAFPIAEPSVSSHHCEVIIKGNDLAIKDLNSTNGTYIDGDKITEGIARPGQVLRLGQIEIRFEGDGGPASAPAAPSSEKRRQTQASAPKQGVKLDERDPAVRAPAFDAGSPFAKKKDKAKLVFIGVSVVLGLVILAILGFALMQMSNQP